MVTGSVSIDFRIPQELLEKAEELGVSEEEVVEKYTMQMECMLYNEIEMSSDEVLRFTLEDLEE